MDETVVFELSNPVNATLGGATQHTLTITDNDTAPDAPDTPAPADMATDFAVDGLLDWADAPGATAYDLFLWPSADPQPGTPTAADLSVSEFQPAAPLDGETEYSWQVVAKNAAGETSSPAWSFTTAPVATISAGVIAR
jgi:hypothetical protein